MRGQNTFRFNGRSAARLHGLSGLLEQLGMRARPDEDDKSGRRVIVEFVCEKKIAADMALAMSDPISLDRLVPPIGFEWAIIGNEQEHRLLQSVQIVSARAE
jgi:hypothetical protein